MDEFNKREIHKSTALEGILSGDFLQHDVEAAVHVPEQPFDRAFDRAWSVLGLTSGARNEHRRLREARRKRVQRQRTVAHAVRQNVISELAWALRLDFAQLEDTPADRRVVELAVARMVKQRREEARAAQRKADKVIELQRVRDCKVDLMRAKGRVEAAELDLAFEAKRTEKTSAAHEAAHETRTRLVRDRTDAEVDLAEANDLVEEQTEYVNPGDAWLLHCRTEEMAHVVRLAAAAYWASREAEWIGVSGPGHVAH